MIYSGFSFFLLIFLSTFPFVVQAANTSALFNPEEAMHITQTLNDDLQQIHLEPFTQVRQFKHATQQQQIVPNAQGEYILHRESIVGLSPSARLVGYKKTDDLVRISGKTIPGAFVILIMHSNESIIDVTHADAQGKWNILLSVNTLTAGEHTASIQTIYKDIRSDEHVIAQFVVLGSDTISNTTWIFLLSTSVLIVLLLIIVNVQFHYRRLKQDRLLRTPPVAQQKDDLISVSMQKK